MKKNQFRNIEFYKNHKLTIDPKTFVPNLDK